MNGKLYCRCPPKTHFPFCSSSLVASLLLLISLSALILAHTRSLPNLVSLAAGKRKEDGGHSEVDKIKDKDASRAGNERGYRIFSSILIVLSFLKHLHLKGFQAPHTAAETIKHTFSATCSTGLWTQRAWHQISRNHEHVSLPKRTAE